MKDQQRVKQVLHVVFVFDLKRRTFLAPLPELTDDGMKTLCQPQDNIRILFAHGPRCGRRRF
ncbi:hypothetical protein ACVWXN_007354 [Bradyrhizobium sp. i1.4.4]|nr:hypothetical protein [Bradyrhizobium barranii]WFT96718.1 hypothetical protein QA633_06250 [Bradyrhizobium barranii]